MVLGAVRRRRRPDTGSRARWAAALVVALPCAVVMATSVAASIPSDTAPETSDAPAAPSTTPGTIDPGTTEPDTSGPPSTDDTTVPPESTGAPESTSPGSTAPESSDVGTTGPESTTVESTAVETSIVESTEPTGGVVAVTADVSVFPDNDGDGVDDNTNVALPDSGPGVTMVATAATTSSTAIDSMTVTLPSSAAPEEWSKIDVSWVRVSLADGAGLTTTVVATHADGTSTTVSAAAGEPITISRDVVAITTTVRGADSGTPSVQPGAVVTVVAHGSLNSLVTSDDDIVDGGDPGIDVCASVTGELAGSSGSAEGCGVVPVMVSTGSGGVIIAAAVIGSWTASGSAGSYSGTANVPATGFPSSSWTSNAGTATGATVQSGASAWLGPTTPFGAAFESTQDQQYLNVRPASAVTPSNTAFTFASPAPVGWGFALGDVDADFVTISATTTGGVAVTGAQLGFQGTFNYCNVSPRPSTCPAGTHTDVPTWTEATRTLTGNVLDTAGATAWFRPTVPIETLTFTYGVLSGAPIYQIWFAGETFNILGAVTVDTGGPAPTGTVLELLDGGGTVIGTTTTAADGSYSFLDVATGTYTVRVVPPAGYMVVGPSTLPADVTEGDATDVDFVLALIPPPTTSTTSTTSTSTTSTTSTTTTTEPPTTSTSSTSTSTTSTTAPATTTSTSTTTTDPCQQPFSGFRSSAIGCPTTSTTSTSTSAPPTTTDVGGVGGLGTTTIPGGALPQSGSDARGFIVVGLTLAAAGGAIVLTARRRRSTV